MNLKNIVCAFALIVHSGFVLAAAGTTAGAGPAAAAAVDVSAAAATPPILWRTDTSAGAVWLRKVAEEFARGAAHFAEDRTQSSSAGGVGKGFLAAYDFRDVIAPRLRVNRKVLELPRDVALPGSSECIAAGIQAGVVPIIVEAVCENDRGGGTVLDSLRTRDIVLHESQVYTMPYRARGTGEEMNKFEGQFKAWVCYLVEMVTGRRMIVRVGAGASDMVLPNLGGHTELPHSTYNPHPVHKIKLCVFPEKENIDSKHFTALLTSVREARRQAVPRLSIESVDLFPERPDRRDAIRKLAWVKALEYHNAMRHDRQRDFNAVLQERPALIEALGLTKGHPEIEAVITREAPAYTLPVRVPTAPEPRAATIAARGPSALAGSVAGSTGGLAGGAAEEKRAASLVAAGPAGASGLSAIDAGCVSKVSECASYDGKGSMARTLTAPAAGAIASAGGSGWSRNAVIVVVAAGVILAGGGIAVHKYLQKKGQQKEKKPATRRA